jgi:uncharacterized protein (DUF1697 family)
MLDTYVALLRGINVGGKHKLPMKDLVAMFGEAGCVEVHNFIQSGNVIFRADTGVAATLPGVIAAGIVERFGFKAPVMLRTVEQMGAVIANNPFFAAGADEGSLHVVFLADLPSDERVAGLDGARSAPDEFVVRGQEIYLRLPKGAAETKLTNAYFDSRLATISTGRNWRTATKLLALMRG